MQLYIPVFLTTAFESSMEYIEESILLFLCTQKSGVFSCAGHSGLLDFFEFAFKTTPWQTALVARVANDT